MLTRLPLLGLLLAALPAAAQTAATATANPPVPAKDEAPSATPPSNADVRLPLLRFSVEGNTLLPRGAIEAAVYPFMGPDRTVADTEKARTALEAAYRKAGYPTVYVQVPPQNVTGGIVRLTVTETRLGTVVVQGEKHNSEARVTRALPSLQTGTTPNVEQVSREVVALNARSPDLQVTPQLKPGLVPGTLDVELAVTDKRALHGQIEVNNQYSRDTAELRVIGRLRYDDLFGLNHSIEALYNVAPENRHDAQSGAITYSAPVPGSRARISITGLVSDSNVTTLGSTNVIGKGEQVVFTLSTPVGRADGKFTSSVQGGFSYKHTIENATFAQIGTASSIFYYPFVAAYYGTLRTDRSVLTVGTSLNFAFRGLGSGDAALDLKRTNAHGDFIFLRSSASYLRTLPAGFNAYLAVDGQLSNDPLVQTEQFSAGGDGSVRGYLQSEALGDSGLHGTFEMRSPTLGPVLGLGKHVDDLRIVAFVDGSQAWIRAALPQQQSQFGLVGVGGGLRVQLFQYLFGAVDIAVPLETTQTTKAGEPRLHFRVYTQF